jgi:hypothetical protein
MIEFAVWAPDRDTFWNSWIKAGICSAPSEYLPPYRNCVTTMDEAWDGTVFKNGELVPGWHTNVRVMGELEEQMRAGMPQCDAEGNPLSIWESTGAIEAFRLEWKDKDEVTGFPRGYRSTDGVVYADIKDIKSPSIMFA